MKIHFATIRLQPAVRQYISCYRWQSERQTDKYENLLHTRTKGYGPWNLIFSMSHQAIPAFFQIKCESSITGVGVPWSNDRETYTGR